jgi:two-component system sensor histidine kinase/response regulator
VAVAASAEEGIADLEKEAKIRPYKLVVMDWKMPGMDGIKASEKIKSHAGIPEKPKIIIATAYGREEVMQKSEKVGVDGFVLKPVGQSVLFDAIMLAFNKDVSRRERGVEVRGTDAEELQKIRGAKVLLAEDNEINQQVAKEILEQAGLVVSIANNGKEAVEMTKEGNYDAVLMDIQMPVMGGFAATREIRKHERFMELPIIAMTAHAMEGDREKSLEAGMTDHVTKPIDPDALFSTLMRWIKPGEREVPGSPPAAAAEKEAQQDILPSELPGIALTAGLERVGGNKKLYRKLLGQFRKSQEDAPERIRSALKGGGVETAVRFAHTVKGVSGNMGAEELYHVSAKLEKALKEGREEDISHRMEEFEAHLRLVMNGIKAFELAKAAQKETSHISTEVSVDKEAVTTLLTGMSGLLESDLMEAMNRLEALKGHLVHSAVAEEYERLEKHVEGFDSDSALKSLENIAHALDIPI